MQPMEKDDSLADFNMQNPYTPFNDSISSIEWMPPNESNPRPPNIFAATTWDGTLRIYEVVATSGTGLLTQKMCIKVSSPIQTCCWNSDTNTSVTLGCSDGFVRCVDLSSGSVIEVGKHSQPVTKVFFSPSQKAIISIGYDKNIHFWQRGNQTPIFTYPTKDKIFVADFVNPLLVLGTSEERVILIDINNFSTVNEIDSPLGKYSQLQSISISPTIENIGFGTVDGRAEIAKLVKNTVGNSTRYGTSHIVAFKSNKSSDISTCYLYPVNVVGFNRRSPVWFFTAGADGGLNIWDFLLKEPIREMKFLKNPITTAKVNDSGELIAYALGNDWHMGAEGIGKWNTRLAVHYISDNELRKSK